MFDRKVVDEFWQTFGKYMSLQPGAEGGRVNWINYKTGIRYVQFKLQADGKRAVFTIELSNPDISVQQLLITQIRNDFEILSGYTNDHWIWSPSVATADGRIISTITQQLEGVNVYLKSDWSAIISFFKPLLTGVDQFWNEQKEFYVMIAG